MRILQIIDSLEVGGAERMAINYANALSQQIDFSGIVATRKEGSLKSHILPEVPFLCLNKRFAADIKAIYKLKMHCKKNDITLVHAHGTSYFTAFLLKLMHPKIGIIWHEHAGARGSEQLMRNKALWVCSQFFAGIIVVNHTLENWCKTVINFKQVLYLPNFTLLDTTEQRVTFLKGTNSKRILCLANLRHPKNHRLLIEVAVKLKNVYPDWTFHLVGKDSNDAYSNEIKAMIAKHQLENTVYIYGLREDIHHIIGQANIGVITSLSEGLPVALLEYGLHSKAVVTTAVGEIPLMISNGVNGNIVPSDAKDLFYKALLSLVQDVTLTAKIGNALHQTILENHSEQAIIAKYLQWIKTDLRC